tara:strand:- start:7025 stop:8953 length:1929 start_codon:yes stop_codon:yes gene_type:complete
MCGIAGVWSKDTINNNSFIAGLKTLNHRGPDNLGTWASENDAIALGHTRLAIIDLDSTGNQPMISRSGRYAITFNGEIYNYKELQSELRGLNSDITFAGTSDTEVMLYIFEYYGVKEGLKKLRGMFAAGLWDEVEKKMYLFRDRAGEKPLYFGYINSSLFFASETSFFQKIDQNLALSPDGVNMYFAQGNIPAPYSIYKNIFKVMPAQILEFKTPEKHASSFYWELDVNNSSNHKKSFQQNADEFETLFLNSVEEQMVADVSLGAFLSGGLDSSAIVSAMQEISSRRVETYSIGFAEDDYNESHAARAVAQHIGTQHQEFIFTAKDALEIIPELNKIYSEPFSDSSQIPTFFLCQETSRNVTVALSGDGGDELFGGYNRYILFHRFQALIIKFPTHLRSIIGKLLLKASQHGATYAFLNFLATRLLNLQFSKEKLEKIAITLMQLSVREMYYVLLQQWNQNNWPLKKLDSVCLDDLYVQLNDQPINSFEAMRKHDYSNYLPNDILVKVDRAAMANSLETRVPFLDSRLIEFAFSLPPHHLIKGNKGKLLVRNFLHTRVPSAILDLPKSGFGVPIEHWLRGPLKVWAESLLFEDIDEDNFLNYPLIQQKWREHLQGVHNWHHHLWSVLMLVSWAKDNNVKLRF